MPLLICLVWPYLNANDAETIFSSLMTACENMLLQLLLFYDLLVGISSEP